MMTDITPKPGERAEITYREFLDYPPAVVDFALHGLHIKVSFGYPGAEYIYVLSGAEYDKLAEFKWKYEELCR